LCNGFVCSECHPFQCDCWIAIQCKEHMAYLIVSSLVHVIHIYTAVNDDDCSGKQTEFRPGVRTVVHVSACNVLRTRKPVFTKRQPAKVLSRALFLKRSAAPRPTISHHREARQTDSVQRSVPLLVSRPAGTLIIWRFHETPARTACTRHSVSSLLPATTLRPLCA
jgi:hypothetical protein